MYVNQDFYPGYSQRLSAVRVKKFCNDKMHRAVENTPEMQAGR